MIPEPQMQNAREELEGSAIAPEIAQRAASDPDHSVWVGASAGSGKTTVLTSRVMRLLLRGTAPQKILCLTFTRAAAAEMSIRVTKRLSFWATCTDPELDADLDRLEGAAPTPLQRKRARRLFAEVLSCPGGMRIRTLHAFCQEILGRFPIEAGISPNFSVIDEIEADALMDEAHHDFMVSMNDGSDLLLKKSFDRLVFELGERGFAPAMRDVLKERGRLKDVIFHAGGLNNLIQRQRQLLALEPSETEESVQEGAVDTANFLVAPLREAAEILSKGSPKFAKRGTDILAWLDLTFAERLAQFSGYCRCFLTEKGSPFDTFANAKDAAKHPLIIPVLEAEALRLEALLTRIETVGIAETSEAVLRLGQDLTSRLSVKKSARAALDYDDLIFYTNNLLHRPGIAPWVLYKLDGGLDHILVDEAQDTSRAQWSIVKTLADEFFVSQSEGQDRTLFVVGDEKQSIFSFQNADPEAFNHMRDYFAGRLKESGRSLNSVGMHISFRSAPSILKAVDAVFHAHDARQGVSSETVRHRAVHIKPNDNEKIGRVEVWPLLSAQRDKDSSDGSWVMPAAYEDEIDPQADLATLIAKTIADWIRQGERLAGTHDPIRPADIMILLRNRGRFADLMVRALKEHHVPVTGVDRMKLTGQLSVMDLLALIQFVLLPLDDLNLATVLKGPLLNCSEDQLMELAIGREGSLWQSVQNKADVDGSFQPFADYLRRWLNEADFLTPFTFLARLLNEPCPGSAVSGRQALWTRLGPDALDPIEELLNAAQNFSGRRASSLQDFLETMISSQAIIKRELDQSGGEVRIMTVHGSKGLEAPIVFLPDTASLPNVTKLPKLLWSRDGVAFYLPRKPKAGLPSQLWQGAREKQMEEYRRLLYVALTRAANRLYIGGWEQQQKSKTEKSWYQLIETGLHAHHEAHTIGDQRHVTPVITFEDILLRPPSLDPRATSAVETGKTFLPLWATRDPMEEPGLLGVFAPSQIEAPPVATPDSAYTRGRIIHRLLQTLPDLPADRRDKAARAFLLNPQHNLDEVQQDEIRREVLQLFERPEYISLFGKGSRAEVPLTGTASGHVIAGQVDRLCVQEDEVWIVDYKTSRPPPLAAAGVSLNYRQQMAAYRAALQDIYPSKAIRCFLLWTYGPRLMELPSEVLPKRFN